jgi:eukaryotic-like serine/threonine-protein kinase
VFPQVFGKYVLERELASGGMAVVYLATLRGAGGFEKRLVVKQIRAELASDEAFVERFVAEAKTTVGLSHPNIVPVYELGVEQGVYFIAMELAQGLTLSELLKREGPLSPEEGAYLGVEICRALDYAHRKAGIVHRDVTPRNVLIDEEGAVRLIDFGIAAPVSVEGSARERVYGSPGHMPIEQLRGGRLTPATDVFAVGALLVEAWTAAPPFRRATKVESDAALGVRPPPLSEHDERLRPLDELVARAVAFDAAARPETAEELARPLREFLRSADLGDIARRLGERVRRARRQSAAFLEREHPGAGTPATPPMPRSAMGSVPPAPVTPSTRPMSQPVTETFATRDEVVEWTRAPSVPPPPGDDQARGGAREGSAAPREGAEPSRSVDALRRAARVRVVLGLAAVVGLAALVRFRARETPAPDASPRRDTPAAIPSEGARSGAEAPGASSSGSVPVAPAASAAASSGLAVSAADGAGRAVDAPSALPSSPLVAARAKAPEPRSAPTPGPEPSTEQPSKGGLAVLAITSDLPAKVAIDGASVGSTPVHGVRKPPGRHVLTVVSVELGERLTATIDAAAGQSVSVHAEFTRAAPTLHIR